MAQKVKAGSIKRLKLNSNKKNKDNSYVATFDFFQ